MLSRRTVRTAAAGALTAALTTGGLALVTVPADAGLIGNEINHNVSNDDFNQAEVAVAVQPNNPARVIAGLNPGGAPSLQAWISDDFMQPGSVVVRDVPTTVRLPAKEGGGTVTPNIGADPVVLADRGGTLWYVGLTRNQVTGRDCPPGTDARLCHIFINRVAAGTTEFQAQTTAIPSAAGVFQDKPAAAIDNWPQSSHHGRIYVVWSPLPSPGRIVLSMCDTRPGGAYTPARCDDPDNWSGSAVGSAPTEIQDPGFFGAVAAAPNGDVYIAWRNEPANAIEINRCRAAEDCTQSASWNEKATVRNLATVNGGPLLGCAIPPEPDNPRGYGNPFGLEAGPDGRLYVVFSDLRDNGTTTCTGSLTDRSVDSFIAVGQPTTTQFPNLQATVRLSDDAVSDRNDHFFPTLSVDASTGEVESSLYSSKADPNRGTVHVYYVRSVDGGLTYTSMQRISTEPSDFRSGSPDDYAGSDSAQGRFYAGWTDARTTNPDQELYMLTPPASLTITDALVTEGDSGTVNAAFTVALSGAMDTSASVHFATADGTANAPGDYATTAGSVTFTPGETTKTVTVAVNGDLVDEANETFFVNLATPTNAVIADGQGVGTIVDDERNGRFSCRAVGLRLGPGQTAVANPPESPCHDDDGTALGATVTASLLGVVTTSVTADGLEASTDQTPDDLEATAPAAGDKATATASATRVRLTTSSLAVDVGAAQVRAAVECAAGPDGMAPKLAGSATMAGLLVNGAPVTVTGHLDIHLAGVTLHLNHAITTSSSVTQRAVWLQPGPLSFAPDVVVGEAKASFTGNPCAQ